MAEVTSYKTLRNRGTATYIDKKSKFIADARPVTTEEEAIAFINEIKKTYPDARHHVYAYKIAANNLQRYSDDSEPAGTAGMPVLDVINGAELVDCVVVVTRYFGGILLGTGGLVRAYTTSARMGVEAAEIVCRKLCDVLTVKIDYNLLTKLQHKLQTDGITTLDSAYEANVCLTISVPYEQTEKFCDEVVDMTNGKAIIKKIDFRYVDMT